MIEKKIKINRKKFGFTEIIIYLCTKYREYESDFIFHDKGFRCKTC